jgi:excisionase family DNA binding protein
MAAKYIELEQAAKMLGVSSDELNNMRLSGEISGVRDGSSWKFKSDELDRVADERGISAGGESEAEFDLDLESADSGASSDLHLDLEQEDSDDSPTAIGKAADVGLRGGGKPPAKPAPASDLGFDMDSESDIRLVTDDSGSEVNLVAGGSDDVLGGTDVGLEGAGVGTGNLDFEGSDLNLGSDVTFEDEAKPKTGKTPAKKPSASADSDVTIGESEDIELGEDDELVLEGGSDAGHAAGDTGIGLASPSDSGLNLEEEPLDLAGSSVSSLELPEDEDLLDLEDLEAEPPVASVEDEDFQLAPSSTLQEDEEDSGSQVIALEDSSAFGAPLEGGLEDAEAVLGEEAQVDEMAGALEEGEAAPVTLPTVQLATAQDLPYSIWNVLSLLAIVFVLAVTGMLMTDLVRNMWTWDETFTASTPIMDVMVRMFGLQP